MVTVSIGARSVGAAVPAYVIAEAGVNHNGDMELAFKLVDVARAAGADAVKFQAFSAAALASHAAPKAEYQLQDGPIGESQAAMLRRLELSPESFATIADYCSRIGITFLASPFDYDSVDLLERLAVPAFKMSSGELTNHRLLRYVATKRRPIILSTGMATLDEVLDAVAVVREETAAAELIALHCVSNYPARAAEVNLRAMSTMADALDIPIGYSDHTLGITVALAAVALGACVIEKHVTLDRSLPGPDHRASLEPPEFREMVQQIRTVELALGHGGKVPAASEAAVAAVVRRSLVVARDVAAGEVLTDELIAERRPGGGLPPSARSKVVGRRTTAALPAGALLRLEDLQ